MKKTLVMIIAIMLIISVCFVCVGCPKTPSGGDNDNKPCTSHVDANKDGKCDVCGTVMQTQSNDKKPTEDELAIANTIGSYLEAWLVNNADTHSANKVRTEVTDALVKKYSAVSKIAVEELKESGKAVAYKLTYSFKTGAKYEQKVNIVAANNGHYAGYEFKGATEGVDADKALTAIINAAFKTCKLAVENGAAFNENGFGFDATAYFNFYYGEMDELLEYGLRLAGQIGIEAKDTFAGIEVLNGNDVIGGLYYQGAENKADCKIYLNAGEYKYYIDNADINAIVASVIDYIQGAIGGGNVEEVYPASDEEEKLPFYETQIKSLADLGISDLVVSMLPIVANEINETNLGNGTTRYQIKINLKVLLDAIKDAFGNALNGIAEKLPAPLNQLDLGSFTGVGGVLLITADVNAETGLGGVELSYNAPKQDFRFSYSDSEPKVYGPINVAIGIKDFELGAQDVAEVIPNEVAGYDYFSPLNAELNVNVEVNEVVYNANIVSNINPFVFEDGVITFVVEKDNAAWMNGRLEIVSPTEDDNGWNGLVVVSVDGQVYRFYTGELASAIGQIAKDTFMNVIQSENIFSPIVNYVMDLIAQFAPEGESEVALTPAGEDEEEGGFNASAIMGALGIVDAAKELIAQWQENGVLVYKLDGEKLLDNYFQVQLSTAEYNAVLKLVNEYIGPVIGTEFPDFDADAAKVLVIANYGDHAKQIYVSVEYKDMAVLVLLDGAKWETEKVIDLTVDVNGDKYILALDASVENVYRLTYTAKGETYVDITLNMAQMTISAKLLANGNEHNFSGALVILTDDAENVIGATIKLNLDDVITEWTGKLGYGNVTGETSFGVPTVEFGAQFGWKIPSNETNVKVDVELVSWGSAVTVADNADLMNLEANADINVALQEMADAFLAAIALDAAE